MTNKSDLTETVLYYQSHDLCLEGRGTNTCTVDVDMTVDNDSDTHSYHDVTVMAYGLVLTIDGWLMALHRL